MHQYKMIDIGGGNSGRACGGRAVHQAARRAGLGVLRAGRIRAADALSLYTSGESNGGFRQEWLKRLALPQ